MNIRYPTMGHSWTMSSTLSILYIEGWGASTVYTVWLSCKKVVDISSFDAIMYIQYKERSRHMGSRLSRGIIISIVSILSLSTLQGCSSLSTGSQDGFIDGVIKGFSTSRYPGQRPWDPPVELGYGARIPNMQGDWDRFCGEDRGERSACR